MNLEGASAGPSRTSTGPRSWTRPSARPAACLPLASAWADALASPLPHPFVLGNVECGGDHSRKCGGPYALTVLETDQVNKPIKYIKDVTVPGFPKWQYQNQCNQDMGPPNRLLPFVKKMDRAKASWQTCVGICEGEKKNYDLAGVELYVPGPLPPRLPSLSLLRCDRPPAGLTSLPAAPCARFPLSSGGECVPPSLCTDAPFLLAPPPPPHLLPLLTPRSLGSLPPFLPRQVPLRLRGRLQRQEAQGLDRLQDRVHRRQRPRSALRRRVRPLDHLQGRHPAALSTRSAETDSPSPPPPTAANQGRTPDSEPEGRTLLLPFPPPPRPNCILCPSFLPSLPSSPVLPPARARTLLHSSLRHSLLLVVAYSPLPLSPRGSSPTLPCKSALLYARLPCFYHGPFRPVIKALGLH